MLKQGHLGHRAGMAIILCATGTAALGVGLGLSPRLADDGADLRPPGVEGQYWPEGNGADPRPPGVE